MLLRTTLIPNSSVQEHRLLRSTFNIAYSANHSSCRSSLRRSCTLSGAVHRTVRFRMEKAVTTTFCSQFDPQTPSWFDHSAEDSSRAISYLVRRLRSSSSLQLYVPSSSLIQQLLNINRRFASVSRVQQCRTSSISCTKSCSDELFSTPVQGGLPVSMTCQQCRTPSTADVMYAKSSNVELHLPSKSSQQCRTKTWRIE